MGKVHFSDRSVILSEITFGVLQKVVKRTIVSCNSQCNIPSGEGTNYCQKFKKTYSFKDI